MFQVLRELQAARRLECQLADLIMLADVAQEQVGPALRTATQPVQLHRLFGGDVRAMDEQRQGTLADIQMAQQDAAGNRFGLVGLSPAIVSIEHGGPDAQGDLGHQDFVEHAADFVLEFGQVGRFVAGESRELLQRTQPTVEPALRRGPILVQGRRRNSARSFDQHRTMRRNQCGDFDQFARLHAFFSGTEAQGMVSDRSQGQGPVRRSDRPANLRTPTSARA